LNRTHDDAPVAAVSVVSANLVTLGRISGLFGVHGWVKVFSYSQPRDGMLRYNLWYLELATGWSQMALEGGHRHSKGVVAKLAGCDSRDRAAPLLGAAIAVSREQFPDVEPGEYYWTDLLNLQVVTQAGVQLGVVDYLLETGANDVLVVKGDRERLIPFVARDVISKIDLDNGILVVDWDPDF
jgi:16S rRNA processing protein RimM